MSRNSLRLLGALILIPSVLLGVMPLVTEHTMWLAESSNFRIDLLGLNLFSLYEGVAKTNPAIYVLAAIGEVLLIMAALRPEQRARYVISPRL